MNWAVSSRSVADLLVLTNAKHRMWKSVWILTLRLLMSYIYIYIYMTLVA